MFVSSKFVPHSRRIDARGSQMSRADQWNARDRQLCVKVERSLSVVAEQRLPEPIVDDEADDRGGNIGVGLTVHAERYAVAADAPAEALAVLSHSSTSVIVVPFCRSSGAPGRGGRVRGRF